MLKTDELIKLIQAVDQSSLRSFELTQGDIRLVLRKDSCEAKQEPMPGSAGSAAAAEPAPAQTSAVKQETALKTITAPMVGTFYAAPEPGAQPFAPVGKQVEPCSVVCVLEAMKLFNEVEAGIAGEIAEVLVKDGEFVEYGQPLFLVKPK